ncbi:hypothetical protein CTAYLR_008161 [Chrysophaeum taylorii]|uniref:HIT domain-containing protein n=1 Tax=Chrysophaeum taylorii TaxID=2483200 RepID=A0AAD7UIL5_9STRA|nr:hypothetical protein CTAYLR_008161 [Chrysophaeum taylorii]
MMISASLVFGSLRLSPSQIERYDAWSFVAQLRPILRGHVVVAPQRSVRRLGELTDQELDALFAMVRNVQAASIARDASVTAFNVAIKDGPEAGQPVPHAHVHVVPRRPNDVRRNDDVYGMLDAWSPDESVVVPPTAPLEVPDDDSREPRTPETMADEARLYGAASGRKTVSFGRFEVDGRQVFYESPKSLAIVNLKPIVPGHVLVIPKRVAPTLADLDDLEYVDLWRSARDVAKVVLDYYGKDDANLAVQDGVDAGQSVPHAHVHILPR